MADVFPRFRSARTVTVVEVTVAEGDGSSPNDRVREVVRYLTPEGELLATRDPAPSPAQPDPQHLAAVERERS